MPSYRLAIKGGAMLCCVDVIQLHKNSYAIRIDNLRGLACSNQLDWFIMQFKGTIL